MENDKHIESTNVIIKIRQLLLNYDLALAYAYGELKMLNEYIELYARAKKKSKKRKHFYATYNKELTETFIEHIVASKEELLSNLKSIVRFYFPKQKDMFYDYMIYGISKEELQVKYHMTMDVINEMCSRFDNDIVDFYSV